MMVYFLRSSAINGYSFCPLKYLCVYGLGYQDKVNLKSNQGSAVHKVLEILGRVKMSDPNRKTIDDDELGRIKKEDCTVEKLSQKVIDFYEGKPGYIITQKDLKTVIKWSTKAISDFEGDMDPRNQNINNVEEFFDIEIPHDWAKYSYEVNGEKIEGQLRIRGTVDVIIDEGDNYFRILDYKGLPVETPIPTVDGWSTMGDLKVGDVVFDQYGQQTKVVAKSDQKVKPCYRITFDDTSTVECDDEHYWKLSDDSVVQIQDLQVGDEIKIPEYIDSYHESHRVWSKCLELLHTSGITSRKIIKIEQIENKLTQCISVDSPDKTYLCTENFIPTHNTGRRFDWSKEKVKTYEDLKNDKQLLFYYYALRTKYAKEKRDFYVSIYYINDHKIDKELVKGGVFDIIFDDSDYERAERMIRREFETIKNDIDPKPLSSTCSHWKCKYLCAFSQIIPEISVDEPACITLSKQIKEEGIDKVTDKYVKLDKVKNYGQGGGRSEETEKKDIKK